MNCICIITCKIVPVYSSIHNEQHKCTDDKVRKVAKNTINALVQGVAVCCAILQNGLFMAP